MRTKGACGVQQSWSETVRPYRRLGSDYPISGGPARRRDGTQPASERLGHRPQSRALLARALDARFRSDAIYAIPSPEPCVTHIREKSHGI